MAKWEFTRPGKWAYPGLGFTATTGDVIEAAAAIDAWWDQVDDSTPATLPVVPPDTGFVETAEGAILAYDHAKNDYVPKQLGDLMTAVAEDPASPFSVHQSASYAPFSTPPLSWIGAALQDGAGSFAIGIQGDSTGDAPDEWVYLTASALAAQYPAYTVQYLHWNPTNQAMDPMERISTGLLGERYVSIKSASGSAYAFTHPGIKQPVGDFDIIWHGKLTAPASQQTLVARFGSSGNRAFRLYTSSSGNLYLDVSPDGTAIRTFGDPNSSIVTLAASVVYLKAQFKLNNGSSSAACTFYSSTDGSTWTQLGTNYTSGAAMTAVFATTGVDFEVGARFGSLDPAFGDHYSVQITDGTGGPSVVPYGVDTWTAPIDSGASVTVGSPVLTIVNASQSGASIDTLTDPTRLIQMTPDYGMAAIILSCSHNDGQRVGANYLKLWTGWATTLHTRFPYADIVILGQNPKQVTDPSNGQPTANAIAHRARHGQIMRWAARNGFSVVDTWPAFAAYAAGPIASLYKDAIHPGPAGSALQRDVVLANMDAGTYRPRP